MAEPRFSVVAAAPAHGFAELKSDDIDKAHSKLSQVSSSGVVLSQNGEISRPTVPVKEQPAYSSSRLDAPLNIVDTIEQISGKTLAQADIVPTSGPRKGSFTQQLPPGFTMPQPVRPVFPGLMRASENPLSKAEVRSTLGASLAPRSGTLPSQPFRHNENTFGRLKSPKVSSPASAGPSNNTSGAMQAIAASLSPAPPPGITNLTSTFNVKATQDLSTPTVVSTPTMPGTVPPFSARSPSFSSKKEQRTYTLPDGTVTTGKGLGRGRPGIKRGPRKSKLATEIRAESPKPTDDTIVIAPLQNKRNLSGSEEPTSISDPSTPSESSSRTSSEEFLPQSTQTRSGRHAQKPSSFVPSSTSTPVAKRPRLSSAGPSIPKPAAFAKIKRKTYRGREHAALCEHCLRGYGPAGNVIVFCDACNKCWHQRCHEPQVSEAVIKDTKAEWYCNDCERIINGPKKAGKKTMSKSKPSLSLSLTPAIPLPLVGASSLTREQREAQLWALSKEKLIDMLMRATDLAPALPLFENPSPPTVTTPTGSRPGGITDSYPTPTQEEEDYEYLYDEHAALYPKPGNGVKLPPESLDLGMLLEGRECKTFSHTLLNPIQRELATAVA